jgi:hypothetical protein
VREGPLLRLLDTQPIFVGFKMDSALGRQLDGLTGPDRQYVSTESSDYLRICVLGKDRYVGKLIHERLTTERVDDIKRNVLSILTRLCPETRFPQKLEILACGMEDEPVGPLETEGLGSRESEW